MKYFADGWSTEFDGPGRRWILYLYGCNLHCGWCANPESFLPPAAGCAPTRLYELAPEALAREAAWRKPLFTGGGGVSFGGGEPTLQIEELLEALDLLRLERVHTAVESNAATERFARVVGKSELLICDLKALSPELLRAQTGAEAELVRENLRCAAREQKGLRLRVPCVRGVNLEREERERLREFICELARGRGRLPVCLLRQHHLGDPKYAALGREYPFRGRELPAAAELASFADELREHGIEVEVFG